MMKKHVHEETRPLRGVQKAEMPMPARRKQVKKRRIAWKIVSRFAGGLFIFVLCIALLFFGALSMIFYGPYPKTRALFVNTVMETSAAKFMARMYLSDEEIEAIIDSNTVDDFDDETTDTGEINVPTMSPDDLKSIEIIDIEGGTYKGKLMIVKDPSRIAVATIPVFGEGSGQRTHEIIIANNAVAGINGGGFLDYGGKGDGGTPDGIIIQNGLLKFGSLTSKYNVIGFNKEHILTLGNMTGQEAMDLGIQEAISFGPFLIMNGVPAQALGTGGGLNPRTAIGQRKDGAVLLLVIDGRQPSSLGGLYTDLIDIMQEYGAYNAANLDGGSSTVMVYEDKIINSCVSLYGPRRTPSAIIVKGETP
ncbi:MAG: phosphodiester glycosidase family protein [Saccharofermentanales bacterium]